VASQEDRLTARNRLDAMEEYEHVKRIKQLIGFCFDVNDGYLASVAPNLIEILAISHIDEDDAQVFTYIFHLATTQ
jgi:hypothetical protein